MKLKADRMPVVVRLVAVVMFAALITVQVLELNYYSAAPSAWPVAK